MTREKNILLVAEIGEIEASHLIGLLIVQATTDTRHREMWTAIKRKLLSGLQLEEALDDRRLLRARSI